MTQAEKDKWVEALRSGDYRQGEGQLCDADGRMCCLGVYLDVNLPHIEWEEWEDGKAKTVVGETLSYNFAPIGSDWFGLSVDKHNELQRMNDTGYDFHEIADFIEDTVPVDD